MNGQSGGMLTSGDCLETRSLGSVSQERDHSYTVHQGCFEAGFSVSDSPPPVSHYVLQNLEVHVS